MKCFIIMLTLLSSMSSMAQTSYLEEEKELKLLIEQQEDIIRHEKAISTEEKQALKEVIKWDNVKNGQ